MKRETISSILLLFLAAGALWATYCILEPFLWPILTALVLAISDRLRCVSETTASMMASNCESDSSIPAILAPDILSSLSTLRRCLRLSSV